MGRFGPILAVLILVVQLGILWRVRCRPVLIAAEPPATIDFEPGPPQGESPQERQWRLVRKWNRQVNQRLSDITDARGRLKKQERWGDFLEPPATLDFQQLAQPLSIYLKWVEPHAGREVLFQEGQRDDRLLVLESTPLGTLAPAVVLSVDHQLARQVSRHPIQEFSLEYIRTELRRYVNRGRRNPEAQLLIDEACEVNGVACRHVRITHPQRSDLAPKLYHRVDIYIRQEDDFPVRWEKYGWSTAEGSQEPLLLEYFELLDVQYNLGATASDFRSDRPDFGFGPLQIPLD